MRACKKCGADFYSWSTLQTTCPKCTKRLSPIGKQTLKYNAWRDTVARPAVIARDGALCWDCVRAKGTDLHHEKGRVYDKYNIDTLRLLCRPCHQKRHKQL